MTVVVAIFAHNEARRIAACLGSLPLDRPDTSFHLLVNGSSDATADIARAIAVRQPQLIVHDWPEGGKSRTWNRFLIDETGDAECFICLDGDAEIAPGSIDALVEALSGGANAAAGMPLNGRGAVQYRRMLHDEGGLFGDLYALSGGFIARMRAAGIRLPDDLIGDDGLVAALAMTDLQDDSHWDRSRVVPCDGAGFLCAPTRLSSPRSWRVQYKRMVTYSMRHFQNRIVSAIMGERGPTALPRRLAPLYREWLPRWRPRPRSWWFDRLALRRMATAR
jgi:glycosyltransferase involved in cell wall biosynthesis